MLSLCDDLSRMPFCGQQSGVCARNSIVVHEKCSYTLIYMIYR